MSRFTSRSLILGAWLLLAPSLRGISEEPPSKEEKYRKLVQQLVSPNKEAVTRNRSRGSVKFPAEYDVKAQLQIEAARQTLFDNFEDALPYLVEALGDERYCMTINWADGDAYYNHSVGAICHNVIASQLEVYREKMRFSGPPHWHRYDYRPISKEWWQARKGRSLPELQIEAINWALERRMVESKTNIDERGKNEISELQKLRDEITNSGKPAKPQRQRLYQMVTSDKGRL